MDEALELLLNKNWKINTENNLFFKDIKIK